MGILLPEILTRYSSERAAGGAVGDTISPSIRARGSRFLHKGVHTEPEVSIFRLNLLRAMYLYIFIGPPVFKWPGILNPRSGLSLPGSAVGSVLGAVPLLALLGLRYPLKMLPLLLFEFVWECMWVVSWGFPLWFLGSQDTLVACLMGVILVPLVMPWGYLFKQYVKAPGDPWRKQATQAAALSRQQSVSSPVEAAK